MPEYKVSLVRSFIVTINAENEVDAKHLSEYFVGYSNDSTSKDGKLYNFEISEIDMTVNEAIEVDQVLSV